MAILMTGLCEKGVNLIWKQCDEEKFAEGLDCLENAMRAGDPEALFFLGHCYSWGEGAVGFNDNKAYECYREGARAGSCRCVPGALRAGQYDNGIINAAAYTPMESFTELQRAAEKGEPFAAYQIAAAIEYENAPELFSGEEKTARAALPWYEKAAVGGIVNAMVKAAKCYLYGQYTQKDSEKAMYYAEMAASRGSSWGLYHMGFFCRENDNQEAAFQYFKAASLQGNKNAPYRLGQMYLAGLGTERDIKKAVEAFETAVARENTEGLAELGDIFYLDEVVERDDERAYFWYSSAYAAGNKGVALPLAHLHMSAGVNQDFQKAEKLFTEAAKTEKDGAASLALGNIYRHGMGREPDLERAVEFYAAGAHKGSGECMEILGNLYFQGDEVEEDGRKAFYWLNRAEQEGILQSYYRLGLLYLKGNGCEADEEKAGALFEIAAESECDGCASYELGYIYEGRETAEDLELAAEYYQTAIDMGNENAEQRFSHFKKNLFGKWRVSD